MLTERLLKILFVLSVLVALPACAGPLKYSAEPIEARVIDAETKQPVEGVIVTANWQLFHSTVGGRVPGNQLRVMEAVTDKDGRFHFPAWGPKLSLWGYLDNRDPQLLLFKPGYEYKRLENEVSSKTNMASRRRSEWNGKTIEMKPFKGTAEEYAGHLSFLKTDLGFAYNGENCEWKYVPRMLVAQHKEMLRFEEKKIFNTLQSVERVSGQKKCGSAQEFFRSYLQ